MSFQTGRSQLRTTASACASICWPGRRCASPRPICSPPIPAATCRVSGGARCAQSSIERYFHPSHSWICNRHANACGIVARWSTCFCHLSDGFIFHFIGGRKISHRQLVYFELLLGQCRRRSCPEGRGHLRRRFNRHSFGDTQCGGRAPAASRVTGGARCAQSSIERYFHPRHSWICNRHANACGIVARWSTCFCHLSDGFIFHFIGGRKISHRQLVYFELLLGQCRRRSCPEGRGHLRRRFNRHSF